MKPVDVKGNTYIESTALHSNKEVNDTDPKFKVGDHVKISKYKNIFAKGYTPSWSEDVFVWTNVTNVTVPWTYVINDLNGEEIIGTFYNYKRLTNKNLGQKKKIKKKDGKLYVKWKG